MQKAHIVPITMKYFYYLIFFPRFIFSILYRLIFFLFLYYGEILHKLRRIASVIHFVMKGGDLNEMANAPLLFPNIPVPQTLVDVDSVVHMCSSNPGSPFLLFLCKVLFLTGKLDHWCAFWSHLFSR